MVLVRVLVRPEEFQEAVEVQKAAWRMPDYREAAPAHVLRGIADNGGLVLGAFDEETGEMVGVSYGFIARDPRGKPYFYSHATGVKEGAKYRGVGLLLKKKQREEALKMGFDLIKWTYDPLQSLNSYFNLSKLGVVARTYVRDYYGEIRDSINVGLGSDRVKAEWWIKSRRVEEKLAGRLRPPSPSDLADLGAEVVLGRSLSNPLAPGEPLLDARSETVLIELPWSMDEVRAADPSLPRRWRLATRTVYEHYLSRGYVAIDYSADREARRGYVILWRRSLEEILEGETPWS